MNNNINTYNEHMYLKTSDLNNIENKIYELTDEIQKKIFNNQSSSLRGIRIGDNLDFKKIYMYFPMILHKSMIGNDIRFIETTNGYFTYTAESYAGGFYTQYTIDMYIGNERTRLYELYAYTDNTPPYTVTQSILCDGDIGVVTHVNTNDPVYKCMFVYDNDDVIPNYVKHTWVDNELLSMQKMDNIERGVANIGRFYYKPQGWEPTIEWFDNTNKNIRSISFRDLNRWVNNLSLINFDKLNEMTIWNTEYTQIVWNKYSSVKWEEL